MNAASSSYPYDDNTFHHTTMTRPDQVESAGPPVAVQPRSGLLGLPIVLAMTGVGPHLARVISPSLMGDQGWQGCM